MTRGVFVVLAIGLVVGVSAAAAGVERAGRTLVVTSRLDRPVGPPIPGSLRDVVENQARAGDTITFARGLSIRLSTPLEISKSLAGLTLQGPVRLASGSPGGAGLDVRANRVAIREITFGLLVSLKVDRAVGVRLTKNTFESQLILFRTIKAVVEKNRCDACKMTLFETTRSRVVGNTAVAVRRSVLIEDDQSTLLEIEGNRIQGGRILLTEPVSAIVSANRLVRGSKGTNGGIELKGPGGGRVVLDDNVVLGVAGDAIVFRSGTRGAVTGGTIRDSEKAGIWVEGGAIVHISRVEMGRNDGPGIDIEPRKVTQNDERKFGNSNLDWPEQLVWDPATGKINGRTCPSCRVEGYDVEPGSRDGNPENGEGFAFLEGARAGADGRFEWPKGKLTCKEAMEITFTATSDEKEAHTSEFSPSPTCAPATFAYSFNAPLRTDFDGPDHGAGRPHVTLTVLDGRACGTDPAKAVWNVHWTDAFVPDFTSRLPLGDANPSNFRTYRYLLNDVETGRVMVAFRITSTAASLVPTPTGNIVNLVLSPSQVPLTKTPVASCN